MALKELNLKVVSFCEIPQELTENTYLEEYGCDVYAEFNLYLGVPGYTREYSPWEQWIVNNYPELINKRFLIHFDY